MMNPCDGETEVYWCAHYEWISKPALCFCKHHTECLFQNTICL